MSEFKRVMNVQPQDAGCFYIGPLLGMDKRFITLEDGSQETYLVFDELTALELASHLEEGAHALVNPGKPMPTRKGVRAPVETGVLPKGGYSATQPLPKNPVPLGGAVIPPKGGLKPSPRQETAALEARVAGLAQEVKALAATVAELDRRTFGLRRIGPEKLP